MAATPLFRPDQPGPDLADRRAAIASAISALDGLAEVLPLGGTGELEELMALTDELASKAAAARFTVAAEAFGRGVVAESDAATLAGWLKDHARSTRQGGCGGIARAVQHLSMPGNASVRAAVETGRIGIPVANAVVSEITRIESRLVHGARETVLEAMIAMGVQHGPSGVRAVRPELLARHGARDDLETEQDRLRRSRALSRPLVADGLHEYRLLLDPEGAAVLEAAIEALSAPAPCEDPETGAVERDLRSSDQRRADALVEVVRASVGTMETRSGRGAKATLLVTMSLQDLRAGSYAGRTLGGLDAGALLDPRTVRRLSCDGEIVPAVLGTAGEILDLGQARRLFPPGQVRALWLRDGGCTYPGCSTPARWADAHHLVHWADGGPTSLDNAALLCGRHHTVVHSRRLVGRLVSGPHGDATVPTTTGPPATGPPRVVWDMTPGSYDRAVPRRLAG